MSNTDKKFWNHNETQDGEYVPVCRGGGNYLKITRCPDGEIDTAGFIECENCDGIGVVPDDEEET